MKNIYAVTLLLLFPQLTYAIVNIESLRMDENKLGWTSQLGVSMGGKKGSVDKDWLSMGIGVQFSTPKYRTFLLGSLEYSKFEGEVDDEEHFYHLRHSQNFVSSLDWEIFAQYEAYPFLNDHERSIYGAGLRWGAKSNKLKGNLGAGAMLEKERINNSVLKPVRANTERFNFYADLKYPLSAHSNWVGVAYYQPKIDDFSDYAFVFTTGLDSQVTESVGLSFDVSSRYDSSLISDVLHQNDLNYNFSLNFEF